MEVVAQVVMRQYSANEEHRYKIVPERKRSEGNFEHLFHLKNISAWDAEPENVTEIEKQKEQLLNTLKKEVKFIMEESVTRRSINLYSNYVTSLCAAVEQCLLDGLKRRLLGLFGARSTYALIHSISKYCPEAAEIIRLVSEAEKDESLKTSVNFFWIRIALASRNLPPVLEFIHTSSQCQKYYEKTALMHDAVKGGVVAALLVGPCEFSYSVSIRPEECWSDDPTADELVQRHRLHSISPSCASPVKSPRRPPLSVLKSGSSIVNSVTSCNTPMCTFGRDYVFSLHQNMKSSLLYGKNNVTVTLSPDGPTMKGYFSLHQLSKRNLTIKWTPNLLMHSNSQPVSASADASEYDWLWRHVINVDVNSIIYIHVHQQDEESPATLVFVGGDGVQHSPIHFPVGHHAVMFLNCLETGLHPYCRLDPPLWMSKDKGKVLPKLRRKTSPTVSAFDNSESTEEYELHDYVFRIVPVTDTVYNLPNSNKTASDPEMATTMKAEMDESERHVLIVPGPTERRTESDSMVDRLVKQNLSTACVSMRKQILARALYGWLAYTGHLKTIRTHLSALIQDETVEEDDYSEPVNEKEMETLFWRRVYLYGIRANNLLELRRQIWPHLIKLIDWKEEIDVKLPKYEEVYKVDCEAWRRAETRVNVRDEEAFTAARLRQQSNDMDLNFPARGMSLASDVFDDSDPVKEPIVEPLIQDPLDVFGTNLHRIQKDVDRCDRHFAFYAKVENREKLKNVLCTYVWRNMEDGYMQGMCDLAAPFLVLYDNESLALAMFECLMVRMRKFFPSGTGMDENLSNMRFLIQVMDPELYDVMASSGDFAHLYFSYRWFLLDFKRELTYPQLFQVWEVIMAASNFITTHFQLFFALAVVSTYRHIIIDNHMDYADVIKFFNEMAEHYDVDELLETARTHLAHLQAIVLELKRKNK